MSVITTSWAIARLAALATCTVYVMAWPPRTAPLGVCERVAEISGSTNETLDVELENVPSPPPDVGAAFMFAEFVTVPPRTF